MRKTISGIRYDTDTSDLIASVTFRVSVVSYGEQNKKDSYVESLYMRPRSRKLFLVCSGGPYTPYAKHDGANKYDGDRLVPLSMADAHEWAYRNLRLARLKAAVPELQEKHE